MDEDIPGSLDNTGKDGNDRGNEEMIVVPYSKERDISKFELVHSQNNHLNDRGRQLQIQNDRLTAGGAPDIQKMAKYIRLSRKLTPIHVKSIQSVVPQTPQHTSSDQPSHSSSQSIPFKPSTQSPIQPTPPSFHHPTQSKPSFPYKLHSSIDLNQLLQQSSDSQTNSEIKPSTPQVYITLIPHTTVPSSIPISSSPIPQPCPAITSFSSQHVIPTISPLPASFPKPPSQPKPLKANKPQPPRLQSKLPSKSRNHPKCLKCL